MRFFLAAIFALLFCISLQAEETAESCIYDGDAVVVGKEYLFVKSVPTKTDDDAPQKQNITQTKITSGNSSFIFITENTKICGREYLYMMHDTSSVTLSVAKKAVKLKKETPTPAKNEIAKQEPAFILCAFPYAPPPSYFLQNGSELAIVTSQQKLGENQPFETICRENTCHDINDLSLYHPARQRQKLSITATQCGELTSFGAQSPPVRTLSSCA